MKIVTIVGARPQFIKAAAGSREIRKYHQEIIVHTGQHYDDNMSAIFFREMDIPNPDYNLGISSGSHAEMTAKMLVGIEKILIREMPDALVVYGDTNSTLAGALAAVKLHIPVIHIEAGHRDGNFNGPEEANRIVTDHLAALSFCATESSFMNMVNEGLEKKSFYVGNIMYDSYLHFIDLPWESHIKTFEGKNIRLPQEYYYMTCHREENTKSDEPLKQILMAMNSLDAPTIYAVHPRNHERALRVCENNRFNNIILVQPVGYLDSINLIKNCIKVVTDSGGLQCEAFFAEKQCVYLLPNGAWPETLVGNRNQQTVSNCNLIKEKLMKEQVIDPTYKPFGDGHAAEKICKIINDKTDEILRQRIG